MEPNPHPFVILAEKAVRHHLDHGQPLPCPGDLSGEFNPTRGTFVCIKNGKQLRGCIGTLTPTQSNLAAEIIMNAISAASKDPRFQPITREELPELNFSVDVLSPPEKVEHDSQLDCRRFGLVVKYQDKQGVLLPDLEGIASIEDQLRICLKKAGIDANNDYEKFRFEVRRYQ